MGFEKIIGQPLAVKLVQRWLERGTTQPLLFYGPVNAGKRALALEAAKALNCLDGGCGRCVSCKKIETGKHPDVRVVDLTYQAVVRGEALEKQQSLRIETVLEERKRLYQTPGEGRWKVSILDDAHRLTADAANVLLKVLEEPPPTTAIFLSTPFRDRIFATIQSRCQPIRFRSLPEKEAPPAAASKPGELSSRATRHEVEDELERMLKPVAHQLRSGRLEAAAQVEWIMKAQQQLRQNVPPNLVYDHLLIKLSKSR